MLLDEISKLDHTDKAKLHYYTRLLLKQAKYKKLQDELQLRREEIKQGDYLLHDELWQRKNV